MRVAQADQNAHTTTLADERPALRCGLPTNPRGVYPSAAATEPTGNRGRDPSPAALHCTRTRRVRARGYTRGYAGLAPPDSLDPHAHWDGRHARHADSPRCCVYYAPRTAAGKVEGHGCEQRQPGQSPALECRGVVLDESCRSGPGRPGRPGGRTRRGSTPPHGRHGRAAISLGRGRGADLHQNQLKAHRPHRPAAREAPSLRGARRSESAARMHWHCTR